MSKRSDAIDKRTISKHGRTGACVQCGLCCLIGVPVKRVPKAEPAKPVPYGIVHCPKCHGLAHLYEVQTATPCPKCNGTGHIIRGKPPSEIPTWGPDLRLHNERMGYRVALETTGYWFMAKWGPCPHLEMPESESLRHGELWIWGIPGVVEYLEAQSPGLVWDWEGIDRVLEAMKEQKITLRCAQYDHRPDCCRVLPANNMCLWLVAKDHCGYNFPRQRDKDRQPMKEEGQ